MNWRLPRILVISTAVGIFLNWACAYLLGTLILFFIRHRYFKLPMQLIVMFELFLAWAPLGFVCGLLLGTLFRKDAVVIGVAAAVASFLFLFIGALNSWSHSSVMEIISFLFLEAGMLLLFFIPFGAMVAIRRNWHGSLLFGRA